MNRFKGRILLLLLLHAFETPGHSYHKWTLLTRVINKARLHQLRLQHRQASLFSKQPPYYRHPLSGSAGPCWGGRR